MKVEMRETILGRFLDGHNIRDRSNSVRRAVAPIQAISKECQMTRRMLTDLIPAGTVVTSYDQMSIMILDGTHESASWITQSQHHWIDCS